jgi:hypothetical protein
LNDSWDRGVTAVGAFRDTNPGGPGVVIAVVIVVVIATPPA